MVEIEFIYNGKTTIIQGNYSDKFNAILQKLLLKLEFDLNCVCYLYNGKTIENKTLSINEIIKAIDKQRNKMSIQIIDLEKTQENLIVNSPQVICPTCKTIARISINDYRIRIYDCINKHDINNILLEQYEKDQKINIAKIICDDCGIRNKGNSYKKIFYFCYTCKKNLCPICKDKNNHENHNVINYDDINYTCQKHNYPYAVYCKTCKNNICILCESEHGKHNTISFGKIIPDKNGIKNNMEKFRKKIELLNVEIEQIINKLIKVNESVEMMYKICDGIIKNNNFKNYEMLQNVNDINFNKYIEDFNEIIENKNLNKKFEKIIDIYNKIINNDNDMKEFINMFNNNNINYNMSNNINNNNWNLNNNNNINCNMSNNMENNNWNMNNNIILNNINNNYDIGINNNLNNNMFNSMNNLSSMNNFNNNVQSPQNYNSDNTIFVTFTFKKNKKQIYVDVNENETFANALKELEDKYNWMKSISNKTFVFNNKKITNYNKTLKQLRIGDNSDILILT